MQRGPTLRRKRRTRAHIIADLAVNHVERLVLRCGWTIERVDHDYGVDLFMQTFDANGEIEPGVVLFQVKATDRIPILVGSRSVSLRLQTRDVAAWCSETMPVILALYDARRGKAYWGDIQSMFEDVSVQDLGRTATTTARIPLRNALTESSVRRIARLKDRSAP